MQCIPFPISGAVLACMAGGAMAAPLSCDQFRDRFSGALAATLSKDVAVPTFTLGFIDPVRGRRFDWVSNGTTGTLKCGQANQFEEVVVNARFENKETFASTLQQFITITGASICALSSDGPLICAAFGRSMLQDTLEQIGRARNRGTQMPSGLSDRVLFPGANAEMTAASTFVTFLLGPGRGAAMDDTRQALPSVERKPVP